jgi:radical SAM protein with 4Fe4S-binding SPASM domain
MNWLFYLKTTETCNLNCKHCFTNGKNGRKIYWNHYKVIDWIKRFSEHRKDFLKEDTLHCEFHGGEPFLAPLYQMRHVWEDCKDLFPNMSWGATTNLVYKFDEDMIPFIRECLGNRIGTSWDPKIRFDNQKQNDLWLKNVKTLIEAGVDVKLFISVTQDTIELNPLDLLDWVKSLGIKELSFERLTGNGNANLHPEIFPSNIEQDKWFLLMHHQSEEQGCRDWFDNEFLETVYAKFETGFSKGGTFCRDCEEKLFTINADGTISGCPNSAPEFQFGNLDDTIESLINSTTRINNIACERARDPRCFSCDVFEYCGGDCHQLSWQDDICGAPKSLMRYLKSNQKRKVWMIKNGNTN